jgi:hypothetical protein
MVRPDRSAESSTGIFQTHALVGGTVNDGPPHTWFTNVGLLWLAARYAFVEKSVMVVTEGLGDPW